MLLSITVSMPQSVIVTGGAGFIGSNIVKELLTRGDRVTVIDDLSTGRYDNIAHLVEGGEVEFYRGTILDVNLLKAAFRDADYVLHQAALPSVQRSVENPLATNEVNVTGTLNVLLTARDSGVKKVVLASSSSVYGDTPTLPKIEEMKLNPKSPYAATKLMCEHYASSFTDIFNLPVACMRYFNVYGPSQNPNSTYAAVIPLFIKAVMQNKSPVINGDGTQTRDFTFVRDVVEANLLAMRSSATGAFNIAYGARVSVNELAEKIMELVGNHPTPVYMDGRKGDVKDSLADVNKARNAFGYDPAYNLDRGLRATVDWYLEQEKIVTSVYTRQLAISGH
jgi:nucleoside-diphosphate-sugar epimerase